MEKGERQNGGPEQTARSHESQRAPRPAPGKVTRTSKLFPSRGAAVQRKAAAAATGAAVSQARPRWDHMMDPWMDAAHRGVTAFAERSHDAVQARGSLHAEEPDAVHRAAALGVSGSGNDLPHLDRIQAAFGASNDLSQVRAHVDGKAKEASASMGAEAYATGNHIAFRGQPDLHTAAHEAAHVVQQRRGVHLNHGVGNAGDDYERHADAVADAVVARRDAAPLLDGGGGMAPAGLVQKQESAEQSSPNPTLLYYMEGSRIIIAPKPAQATPEAVTQAFSQVGAQTCPAQYDEVSPSDPTWALFHALYLDQQGMSGQIDWRSLGRVVGSMTQSGELGENPELPANMQQTPAVAPGQLQPGPWSPPGNQPIPFYVGNEAHIKIAQYYRGIHAGDLVFDNFTPLSTILEAMQLQGIPGLNPSALGASGALRPDILNVPKRRIFEIKPQNAQAVAAAEVQVYVAALARAGLVVTLGPSSDPGANGVLPAPAGYFRFWSPMPGVIVYQYTKSVPEPVPVPVPVPQEQPEEQPHFDLQRVFEWEYWEEVTGLTGAALVLYLIVSEGSRLYPPRNAIPIP